jgi:uncharacterized protein YjaZ
MSTAKRSPPFRAEHVGSLLRPDELVQKRYAVAAGKADAEELKPIEDKSVTEVVKLQKDCGFHAVSSGEYTRYVFLFFASASQLFSICSIIAHVHHTLAFIYITIQHSTPEMIKFTPKHRSLQEAIRRDTP